MKEKIRIIMIDAFKPEYLQYAPYLASLTKKYQWGELEMPMGHWGGIEILFKGDSKNLSLFYKTNNSSLKWIKYFIFLENLGKIGNLIIDYLINFQRLIKREELVRMKNIPLRKIHEFDTCIKKPLFKKIPIKFEYIGTIDKISHKYGTKSKQTIETIKKVDKKLSKTNFNIILSDHGMINIKKIVKVPETNNCFIDSDMARYWGDKEELNIIQKKLPLNYGKIINWPNKKFGELIFLANTGTLISPNYWQGNKKVKAMHGYDGKHKDMKAFYIIKKRGNKKNIKIKRLHQILKEMIKNGR